MQALKCGRYLIVWLRLSVGAWPVAIGRAHAPFLFIISVRATELAQSHGTMRYDAEDWYSAVYAGLQHTVPLPLCRPYPCPVSASS